MSYRTKLDLFEYSPILSILPTDSELVDVSKYSTSFHARLERAKEEGHVEEIKMLETILEWILK